MVTGCVADWPLRCCDWQKAARAGSGPVRAGSPRRWSSPACRRRCWQRSSGWLVDVLVACVLSQAQRADVDVGRFLPFHGQGHWHDHLIGSVAGTGVRIVAGDTQVTRVHRLPGRSGRRSRSTWCPCRQRWNRCRHPATATGCQTAALRTARRHRRRPHPATRRPKRSWWCASTEHLGVELQQVCAVIGVCTDIHGNLAIAQRATLSSCAKWSPRAAFRRCRLADSRTGRRSRRRS